MIYIKNFAEYNELPLEILNKYSQESDAVEIQKDSVNTLKEQGFNVFESLDDLKDDYYDIVTLFHVFEHFTRPIEELLKIKKKLKKKYIASVNNKRRVCVTSTVSSSLWYSVCFIVSNTSY